MIRISICEYCRTKFSYNNKDSKGKFCSQTCHYASKNEKMSCIECGKEFIKRKKDMRKSCSTECFKNRRMKKSTKSRKEDSKLPKGIEVNKVEKVEKIPEKEYQSVFQSIVKMIKNALLS